MKKRLIRWIILLSIGFGIGMAIKYYKSQPAPQSQDKIEQVETN